MKTGAQYAGTGTKYPFREDDPRVSNIPANPGESGTRSEVPCNLFSEVVVDCVNGPLELVLTGVSTTALSFSLYSPSSAIPVEEFSFGPEDFTPDGRTLHISENAVVQIETRFENPFAFSVSGPALEVRFDPHCRRLAEQRLVAFSVGGQLVSGDVLFKAGHNAALERPAYDTSDDNLVSFDFTAGLGEGRWPCKAAALSDSGISAVLPDASGAVRFEPDDCYSVVPRSENVLQILGHCSSCCSCVGDYLPAANAAGKLINRLNALIDKLDAINKRYGVYIDKNKPSFGKDNKIDATFTATKQVLNHVPVLSSDVEAYTSRFQLNLALALANKFLGKVVLSNIVAVFDNGRVTKVSYNAPPDLELYETNRTFQVDGDFYRGESAIANGIELPPGGTMLLESTFRGEINTGSANKDKEARRIFECNKVHMLVSYYLYNRDGTKRKFVKIQTKAVTGLPMQWIEFTGYRLQ